MRSGFKAFIGLDVHKDSIAIAYADADFTQAPRFLGTTGYSLISLTKALAKLGNPGELSVGHEAGPVRVRAGEVLTGARICHRGNCSLLRRVCHAGRSFKKSLHSELAVSWQR